MLMSIVELIRSRISSRWSGSRCSVAVACGSVAAAPPPADGPLVQQLTGDVSDARAMKHCRTAEDRRRAWRQPAAGTAGYDASVEYVAACCVSRVQGQHPDL
jgi:hypothetical protein